MNSASLDHSNVQHSMMKSFHLHILPGVLVTVAFFLFKPLVTSAGYPPLLAFLVAVLLVDIPFMLGVMFFEGKKRNGRFSLEGIVQFREKLPWKS